MGKFIQNLFGIKANPQVDAVDRSVAYPLFSGEYNQTGYRPGPDATQDSLDNVAMQISWVFSAVRLISNKIAAANYQVVTRKGEDIEPVIDHPLETIVRKPNPYMGSAFLKAYTAWWLNLRGEAAWMLVSNKLGELVELWPIPMDRLIPIEDENEYVMGYAYYPRYNSQEPIPLAREEVCFFRFPHPKNYHRGMSPLTGLVSAIKTDYLSSQWNIGTFENEATLRQIISLPPQLNTQKFRALRQEILEELGKGKRFMVVRGGDVAVDGIGLTQKDVEYLAARELSRTEIDRVYGIPEGYWSAQATRSNAEAARLALAEDAIMPVLRFMSGDIDTQILECYYPEQGLSSEWEDVRPKDQKVEIAAKKVFYDSLTVNEVRVREGLGELDSAWGELPWALRNSPQAMQFVTKQSIAVEGDFTEVDNTSLANPPGDTSTQMGQLREPRLSAVDNSDPEGIGDPQTEQKSALIKIARETELKQWKAVSLRMLAKNRSPLDYQFDNTAIDDAEAGFIRQMLLFMGDSKHAVKSLFTDIDEFLGKADINTVLDTEYPVPEGVATTYYETLESLVIDFEQGGISRGAFINGVVAAAQAAIVATFLAATGLDSADQLSEEAQDDIAEAMATHETSAELLADDIAAGAYSPDVNENAEGSRQSRVALWILALSGIYAIAQLSALGDDELVGWEYGPTDHCEDCSRLNGQVHTKAAWRKAGWYPRAYHLACKGYWCQCRWTFGHTTQSGNF